MKIYQIQIDTMLLTLIAENENHAFKLLNEKDKNVFIKNGKYKYKWSDDFIEEFEIIEVPMESGIIQWESH